MEQVVRMMIVSSAVDEWEQDTFGTEINHGNGPYLTGFLDALHVGIDIFSATVLYALIGLNVFVVRVEEGTVEWGEQYDLLVREGIAEHLHRNVDATAEGVGIIAEATVATFHQLLWLAHGCIDHGVGLRIPLAYPHAVVVIVGTHQDNDGIEVIAMLSFQLLELTRNVAPLPTADAINIRCDVEQSCR